MATLGGVWSRLGLPLRIVLGLVLAGLVVGGLQILRGAPVYHARLHHAAGLESGDDVRLAGLKVGEVSSVTADRDEVDVAFTLEQSPEELGVTDDSSVEVKLLSILGDRFLALSVGSGNALADGGTIGIQHAVDTYTMERFWLDSTPQVRKLDMPGIERAIDVLSTDAKVSPDDLRDALDGITGVSRVVQDREQQLDDLLSSTHQVTRLVLDQTDQLDRVLANGTLALRMVQQQRRTLAALLRDTHRFVVGLTAVVKESAPRLAPALTDLRSVLQVLREHRADLDRTLRLAGPTMRVFTNATGDGPWLGVNAPYAIVPDDLVCSLTPEDCK
ncbi:MlaD family protein [Nocardioides panacisoli]|uniref:MCE family protein n=1 Tax=Nocardioides panacisoli TaxID=627624 RepID=A0ABP7I207_9ACTN